MEMEKIREQLARLTELIDGWTDPARVSDLERDLVLEKLRTLYEAVRFVRPAAVAVPQPQPVAEVATVAVAPEPAEDVLPAVSVSEPAVSVGMETPSSATVVPVSEKEPVAASEAIPTEDVLPAESESEPAESCTAAPASCAAPSVPGVFSEESAPVQEPDMPVVAEVGTEKVSDDKTQDYLEELVARRREKRRIIRSLYESDDPESFRSAAASGAAESVREPEAPAVSPEPLPTQAVGEPVFEARPVANETAVTGERLSQPQHSGSPAATHVSEEVPSASEPAEAPVVRPAAVSELTPASDPAVRTAVAPGRSSGADLRERSTVLGEVIGGGPVLGETIPAAASVASEIVRREPIADLREAIGINDKFLLVRDLFAGDVAACERAIERLNAFDDLDDCLVFIAETYDWNPASEGVKLLVELLERKLA